MKISSITALCAMALAGTVQAQSADVNVSGKIKPPACNASFTGGADLDWGEIAHADLSATDMTVLDGKSVTLQITCEDGLKTHVAFRPTDPNKDSALVGVRVGAIEDGNHPDRIFGIGFDPVTKKKIGNFTMLGTSTSYDGTVKNDFFGYNGDATDKQDTFSPAQMGFGVSPKQQWTVLNAENQPAAANTMTFTFNVVPQLNKAAEITNLQAVSFSGQAQFNVRYF